MERKLTLDTIEERAAIIAEACHVSQGKAEKMTAEQNGFQSWGEMLSEVKRNAD